MLTGVKRPPKGPDTKWQPSQIEIFQEGVEELAGAKRIILAVARVMSDQKSVMRG